ncbi:Zn-ribbon domain-containing OB-fold protein [Candidatus Micrarchaeota archaeon]|nr:Zn-ribbon domain-containing OB-fold protein [Candidatus Micrarchaeota archaeon]
MRDALPLIWRKIPERYTLLGSHCNNCKTDYFPQRTICPHCRSKGKLVDKQMPREGKVYSFTEVHSGPAGFQHETPYFLAIIELPNKVKVLSQLVDSSKDKVKVGAPVKMVFRRIFADGAEGVIAYGFKFKVVN